MRVLVTTGSWRASRAVMESLSRQGHEVFFLDHDVYSAGFHSRYCKEGLLCAEEVDAQHYVEAIGAIVKSRRYDLLIPMSRFAILALSEGRASILPYIQMLLPAHEVVTLACQKDRTYRFALDHDIPVPTTYFPQSLKDVDRCAAHVLFPCIVKHSPGTTPGSNYYFYNNRSLTWYFERLEDHSAWPVIQEFVQGQVCGVSGVAQEGEVLDCLMFKSDGKCNWRGTVPHCTSIMDEGILHSARKVIKLLNWTGAFHLDFLKDRSNQILLLEIYPSFCGATAFAFQLGVDLPSLYLNLVRGRVMERFRKGRYKAGVVFHSLATEIVAALREKKSAAHLFWNLLNPGIKTDIPWNDPKLLMWELRHILWYCRDTRDRHAAERIKSSIGVAI
jgi:predicted ATP-grasp superfamily ATP-dependent carboligase